MRSFKIGFGAMSLALAACGVFGGDDPEPAGPGPAPTPQEEEKKADENSQAPAVGTPLEGIFVSSSLGNDEGTGSMERPLKTLAKGLAVGKATGTRVLVCAEDYPEAVTLVDGVSAFGNIDCKQTPWVAKETARARILAPTTPAVTAKNLKLTTKLESFEVIAPDLDGTPATDEVGTSIALEARDSKGLIVVGSLLHAGKGAPGTDGVEGPVNVLVGGQGVPAVDQGTRNCTPSRIRDCTDQGVPGGAGGVPSCTIGPSGGPGGKGGDGQWYADRAPAPRSPQYSGLPLVGTTATAKGGVNPNALGQEKGQSGTKGAAGTEGDDGSNGTWTLAATGFLRGNGTAGTAGGPGQGGGGGAGTAYYWSDNGGAIFLNVPYFASATGGSGGGGGCGGQPGTPATGGGASIAALLVNTIAAFDRTRLESSAGGSAGKGNLGTYGTVGGIGGLGTMHGVYLTSGRGGDGGPGGFGGASGHGAPGPSIAVAYTEKPTMTAVELAPGPAGAGQPELKKPATSGFKVLPAVVGESKAEHVIKP